MDPSVPGPATRRALPATMLAIAMALRAAAAPQQPPVPDFGRERVSPDAMQVATWALASGDAGRASVVIVDKKQARVFVLDPAGRLRGAAPALLGQARGDRSAPGIGERPLSQIRPQDRTTPAGRFIPEPGVNTHGEDIVWVDYDSAVSMHRVRAQVKAERRLQRLASPTPADNRISFGCINLPPAFYEQVLVPAVRAGAVVYVLPDTLRLSQVFPQVPQPARPSSLSAAGAGDVRQQVLPATDDAVLSTP